MIVIAQEQKRQRARDGQKRQEPKASKFAARQSTIQSSREVKTRTPRTIQVA